MMRFSDEQAAFLVAAGRLLQGDGIKIERLPGETYPVAVLRIVSDLPADERDRLRDNSIWVSDYEKEERVERRQAQAAQPPLLDTGYGMPATAGSPKP